MNESLLIALVAIIALLTGFLAAWFMAFLGYRIAQIHQKDREDICLCAEFAESEEGDLGYAEPAEA